VSFSRAGVEGSWLTTFVRHRRSCRYSNTNTNYVL